MAVTILSKTNDIKEVMTYAANKVLLNSASYDAEMNLTDKTENVLNKDGLVANSKQYRNDALSRSYTYTYDATGKAISRADYDSNGEHIITEAYTYDANGNEQDVMTTLLKGNHSRTTASVHNEQGDLTQYDTGVGATLAFSYSYDSKNNWIEKKQIKNELVSSIEVREIVYYA